MEEGICRLSLLPDSYSEARFRQKVLPRVSSLSSPIMTAPGLHRSMSGSG